jgi:hypothetical protein
MTFVVDGTNGLTFPNSTTQAVAALPLTGGTLTGTTTFTGGVANAYGFGVGTAVPSSGAGISFPATQSASSDANTLDDYEEGTFTLTVTSSGGSLTSYNQQGFYTKIGRIVTIIAGFQITNAGTASGHANLSGFPFTAITATTLGQFPSLTRETQSTGNAYQVFINSNATTGTVISFTNTGLVWSNNYTYSFTLTYQST